MTKNIKGLMHALQQSINEAILASNDVAAALAALKRTGKYPVFTINVALEDAPFPAVKRVEPLGIAEELVLDDADVAFLAVMGVSDPSWSCTTTKPGGA